MAPERTETGLKKGPVDQASPRGFPFECINLSLLPIIEHRAL